MLRLINEKLAQGSYTSTTSADGSDQVTGNDLGFSGNVDVENIFGVTAPMASFAEWTATQPARQRASSTVSSVGSSSVRVFDEGWQSVEDTWAVPDGTRRATFDQSDFMRYRHRPAWKCKHCEGVGWSEEEPCDGCGRFLPENYAQPRGMRMMREGDWLCESCGNTNWEWRTQCNRCHTCRAGVAPVPEESVEPKVVAPVDDIVKQRLKKRLSTHPAGVFKDNDWVCTSCGNINWDWRVKCHQCAASKPVLAPSSHSTGLPPRNAHRVHP